MVEVAHQIGLQVHPWTIRADDLPSETDTLDTLHRVLFSQLGVDGAFSDFPDLTRKYVDALGRA